jgi:hypothetical protein
MLEDTKEVISSYQSNYSAMAKRKKRKILHKILLRKFSTKHYSENSPQNTTQKAK